MPGTGNNPEHPARAEVELYNLGGERVAALAQNLPAGKSALAWDCRQAAPGLYPARVIFDRKEICITKVAVVR